MGKYMASGNIKGITIEFNGDTTKLGKALKEVDGESRKVNSSLKEIENSLKFNPGNGELVAQQQRKLSEAIDNTKEKLKILQETDKQAKAQLEKGEIGQEQYDALQREIIKTNNQLGNYENKLKGSKEEQGKMLRASALLGEEFKKSGKSADDFADIIGQDVVNSFKKGEGSSKQMENALKKIKKENEEVGKAVEDSGKKFDLFSQGLQGLSSVTSIFEKITNLAKQMGQAMAEAWKEVDDGLDTVVKKTGASGDNLKGLQDEMTNVFTSLPVTAQEAGDAVGEVNTQFQLTGEAVKDTSSLFLKFSQINDSDVNTSIQSTKAVMSQFGLTAKDIPGVLDSVTKAAQDTGVSTDKIFDSMTKGAPVLRSLGLDYNQSAILMSRFEQAGLDSSKSLSYLTKAQATAAKEGKTLSQTLEDFNAFVHSGASDTQILNRASELFGTKGGAMMAKAAKDGSLNFKDLAKTAQSASGTVNKTFEDTQDPADKFTIAQNNAKAAMASFAQTAQELLAPMFEMISKVLTKIKERWDKMSPRTKKIIAVIAMIVAAMGTIIGVVIAIGSAIAMAMPIITAVGGVAVSVLGAIFSPITLIVAAVAGLIALIAFGIKKLIEHKETIKKWFSEIDKLIKAWFDDKKAKLTATINGAKEKWNNFKAFFTTALEMFKNMVKSKFNGVKNAMLHPFVTAQNAIKKVVDKIKGFFNFKVSLPHIKLPHFSVTPPGWHYQDLLKGTIPKLGISWYQQGGIFDRPAVIGVGEAGKEAVMPLERNTGWIDILADKLNQKSGGATIVNNITFQSAEKRDIDELVRIIDQQLGNKYRNR